MSILDRFFNRKVQNITENDIANPLLKALLGGEEITRKDAMSIPAVSSNVDLLSSMIACMPIKLYKDDGEKVEEIKNDKRLPILNDDTNDLLDAFQWKKAIIMDYLMGKGGYSYIKRSKNEIKGIYYVECEKITPYKNTDPIFKSCEYGIDEKRYKNYEIFRILRNTRDGITGESIVSELSKSLDTAFNTLLYQLNLVKKGGNKKGFLTTTRRLGKEEIELLKSAWKSMYQTNQESVIVLNEGMEFKESSNSSVEMQLDQSKTTLNKEIDKIFHVGANFDDTFKEGLLPIIKSLESALNRYLLLEKEKQEGLFFEIDSKEITRANLKERYDAYHQAIQDGWLNRNEVRYEENRDKIEGLDDYNMSLGSVLFDPETKSYFVPNTGQVQGENSNSEGGEEDEL